MATTNDTGNAMRRELTEDERLDLSMNRYAMDSATAQLIFKIRGTAAMVAEALNSRSSTDAPPDGLSECVDSIQFLAEQALARAGCWSDELRQRTPS